MITENIFDIPAVAHFDVQKGRSAIIGGRVRSLLENTTPHDTDIYYFNEDAYFTIIETLDAELTFKAEYITIHKVTGYKYPIELIFEPAKKSVQDCIDLAEFDICAGCYSEGKFFSPPGLKKAVVRRCMRFLQTKYPDISMDRLRKYLEYGYSLINPLDIEKMLDTNTAHFA